MESTERAAFVKEIAELINKRSLENQSNTPDFILAEVMVKALESFEEAAIERDRFWNDIKGIYVKSIKTSTDK